MKLINNILKKTIYLKYAYSESEIAKMSQMLDDIQNNFNLFDQKAIDSTTHLNSYYECLNNELINKLDSKDNMMEVLNRKRDELLKQANEKLMVMLKEIHKSFDYSSNLNKILKFKPTQSETQATVGALVGKLFHPNNLVDEEKYFHLNDYSFVFDLKSILGKLKNTEYNLKSKILIPFSYDKLLYGCISIDNMFILSIIDCLKDRPISHSEIYKEDYHPALAIIRGDYIVLLYRFIGKEKITLIEIRDFNLKIRCFKTFNEPLIFPEFINNRNLSVLLVDIVILNRNIILYQKMKKASSVEYYDMNFIKLHTFETNITPKNVLSLCDANDDYLVFHQDKIGIHIVNFNANKHSSDSFLSKSNNSHPFASKILRISRDSIYLFQNDKDQILVYNLPNGLFLFRIKFSSLFCMQKNSYQLKFNYINYFKSTNTWVFVSENSKMISFA
jgi:hypothetical protein